MYYKYNGRDKLYKKKLKYIYKNNRITIVEKIK